MVGCEPVAHELQELSQFYGIGGIQAGTGHRDLSGRLARPACCQLFVDIAGAWSCWPPAFWPGWSARRPQAMSVYLLAVVWDRPNTRA